MSMRPLGALAAMLALPSVAGAQTPPGDVPTIPFERYALDNGLTVILHQDNRLPLVAVSVWYDVGARHEKPGKSGFAHLFEHMMFQGTPHVGEDMHFKRLEAVGATNVNGTTSLDRTNYFETVPSHQLELALWLESDRMAYLLTTVTQKSLDNQIEVVKNERRQSYENAPYGMVEEKLMQTLYPPTHPYHGNVIGSMADLSAATLDDVREFFKTYYTPANATLAIAGDIDVAKTKALVEKYFGPIEGRAKPPKVVIPPPGIEKELVLPFDEPVANLPKLVMTWMGPSVFEPGTAELELLTHVISGVRSSRLDKKVTFDDLIAQSVTANLEPTASGSLFSIELVVQPGRTLEEAKKAVDDVLADLRKHPPTEAELVRAKNALETRVFFGLELLGGFGGRAEQLQEYNLFLGDPGKLAWDVERYRKVTTKDLSAALDRWLTDRRVVILATPKKADAAAVKGAK
ncbi:insulinase family protein [Myxococcota bacterium]|nr:insulinase family protein [Myxococcota bacterium]